MSTVRNNINAFAEQYEVFYYIFFLQFIYLVFIFMDSPY